MAGDVSMARNPTKFDHRQNKSTKILKYQVKENTSLKKQRKNYQLKLLTKRILLFNQDFDFQSRMFVFLEAQSFLQNGIMFASVLHLQVFQIFRQQILYSLKMLIIPFNYQGLGNANSCHQTISTSVHAAGQPSTVSIKPTK